MDTFRLRLREYLDERGISVYALIQASGLAPNTAYAIARGSSGNARLDTVAAIVTGLRRLTGENVALSDILVHESTPDLTTSTNKARVAPEKPESGLTADDNEWLETFLIAAKGQSTSAAPYDPGSVVLVQFDRQQVRPCVTLTRAKAARESQICGIVPLAVPLAGPTGGLTPTFQKGRLPAKSTVMCTQVQTVEPAQVVGFVGQLDSRQLKQVKNALEQLFSLDRAADGRYTR